MVGNLQERHDKNDLSTFGTDFGHLIRIPMASVIRKI